MSHARIQIGKTGKRTGKQVEKLCEKYKKFIRDNPKAKTSVAAEALGITPMMVGYIRRKIGVAPKRSAKSRDRLKNKIRDILLEKPDLSNRELAERVGRPKTTVVSIRKELQMGRETTESILFISIAQQVRQIVVSDGLRLTDRQLANRVGVSLSTLHRWLVKLGIPRGKERRYGDDEEYFKKMWADGWSDVEISRVMGCVYQRVQKWRYRNKLPANVIHHSLRTDAICRSHTPSTLLDVLPGSPTGSKKYDRIWAFGALGADWDWLRKRFPDISRSELKKIVRMILDYKIPSNFRKIIRRKQLEGYG